MQASWRVSHADPEPTFGTLHALIGTGDLNLIRDDSVRAAPVWIGERSGYYDARLRRWEDTILRSLDTLSPMVFSRRTARWVESGRPTGDLDEGGTGGGAVRTLPTNVRLPPFVDDPVTLLDDPSVYGADVSYLVAVRNHLRTQERLLTDVRTAWS